MDNWYKLMKESGMRPSFFTFGQIIEIIAFRFSLMALLRLLFAMFIEHRTISFFSRETVLHIRNSTQSVYTICHTFSSNAIEIRTNPYGDMRSIYIWQTDVCEYEFQHIGSTQFSGNIFPIFGYSCRFSLMHQGRLARK